MNLSVIDLSCLYLQQCIKHTHWGNGLCLWFSKDQKLPGFKSVLKKVLQETPTVAFMHGIINHLQWWTKRLVWWLIAGIVISASIIATAATAAMALYLGWKQLLSYKMSKELYWNLENPNSYLLRNSGWNLVTKCPYHLVGRVGAGFELVTTPKMPL